MINARTSSTRNSRIVIGTRGSALALWQAEHVRSLLQRAYPRLTVDLKIIKTQGDKNLISSLSMIGGKGVFTKELEHALLRNEIDLAVHSLKDLPTSLPKGLAIGCIPKREDVRDVFLSTKWKRFDKLPEGAVVATGSLRRKSQLLHLRPDLDIVDLRGNVQSRLKKLEESDWDGMILAHAGLKRLKLRAHVREVFSSHVVLPAVGQGALGIEIRKGDARVLKFIRTLHHPATAAAAAAERALLAGLGGGCQVPIGAHARVSRGGLVMDAFVARLDGAVLLRVRDTGTLRNPGALGTRLAQRLYANGAKEILDEVLGPDAVPATTRVNRRPRSKR